DARQATNAGTDNDADTFGVGVGDFETGVLPGLHASHNAVMDEGIHLAGFLGGKVVGNVKVLDLAGNPGIEVFGVETGDGPYPRAAIDNIVPGGRNIVTDWRNNAQPGNHDASFHE